METLENAYSGALFDVLRELGYPHQALPPDIAPIDRTAKIVGPVFTLTGRTKEISEHESLLRWCGFLSKAPAGSVVVCQPNDALLAHMGELSAETLKSRGVRGYVVDGGCRDTAFIHSIEFPVFCKYRTSADIVGKWSVEATNEPIAIGNLRIEPGDFIMGDCDGVVLVPAAAWEECVTRVETVMNTENKVRTAILRGVDPVEAYLQYGRF